MGPQTIGIGLLLALLVLAPTRRLARGGTSRGALAAYFLGVWLLSLFVVLGGGHRLLVAVLLVVYIAPFVTLRAGFAELLQRLGLRAAPASSGPERPVVKDVTPPDEASPPA